MPMRFCGSLPLPIMRLALVASVCMTSSAGMAQSTWYGFVDENGVINISDTQSDPRASAFDPRTFEVFALRQVSTPHAGIDRRGEVPALERALTPMLVAAARKHGIDLSLVKAVVAVESGFQVAATSRAGALGLMQLMPATAKELGVNPLDPTENVDGGTRYLAGLLRMFGDEAMALAAYNAGPGRVRRAGRIPKIPETERYVRQVLSLRAHYARTASRVETVDDDATGAFIGR